MMPLFDDFTKKAAKFTEEAIDKTQELAGTAKLKLKMKTWNQIVMMFFVN